MSMTVADDAIIEAENQVNFNWARILPSHLAATHTMYALALGQLRDRLRHADADLLLVSFHIPDHDLQ